MPAIPPGCPASRHAMKRIFTLMLATLLLGLLGCQGTPPTPTTTPPTTHTPTAATTTTATAQPPTVLPTRQPTPTSSPRPTRGPTSTPTPRPTPTAISGPTWRILFRGFSCERRSPCSPFDDTQFKYYAINSDGTDLEQLQISSFPPTPTVPEDAPTILLGRFPRTSPDGSTLLYVSSDRNLYIVDKKNGEATLLSRSQDFADDESHVEIGPACWSPEGTMIRFAVQKRKDNTRYPTLFYTVSRDGNNLQTLFTLPALKYMSAAGDCSPEGREMAIPIPQSPASEKAGLYVVDLDHGTYRQILYTYYISRIRAAPNQP